MNIKEKIANRIFKGERLSKEEGLALFDFKLPELGFLAREVRFR